MILLILPSVKLTSNWTNILLFIGHDCDIIQIAAVRGTDHFSRYILPEKPIHPEASKVTGITVRNRQMYYKEQLMETVSLEKAFKEFVHFLGARPVLLIGHNVKVFDAPILLYASRACGVNIEPAIHGFLDTLLLFRGLYRDLAPNYKQDQLYQHFFPGEAYDAHNALADVVSLQALVARACPSQEDQQPFTFDMEYVKDTLHKRQLKKHHLNRGWWKLIEEGVVSEGMGKKAAGSGLGVGHLKQVYAKSGAEGVKAVLSETIDGETRVTKQVAIIDKINQYLSTIQMEMSPPDSSKPKASQTKPHDQGLQGATSTPPRYKGMYII